MKKIIVISVIAVLVAMGSGLTFMFERFDSVGTTAFYEKDSAPGTGSETVFVYNEGITELKKAIVADKPVSTLGARMSVNEKIDLIPGIPTPTCTTTTTTTCTPTPTPTPAPDPYRYEGVTWGPDTKVRVNDVVVFDGTVHQTYFDTHGYGQWESEIQGDARITEYLNKQMSPDCQPFLPVPTWEDPTAPSTPPAPVDP